MDSTRNLVISLFPPEVHANRSLQTMASLLEDFTRAGTLHARLDALVAFYSWLRRKDNRLPELRPATDSFAQTGSEWRRERVWLSILEASPELRDRYQAGVAAILDETDAVSLFAQSGLPTDRGLLSETFDRFFRIVLPAPREETDLAKLFLRLFPTQNEVDRFFSQSPDQLRELASQIAPVDIPEAWDKPLAALRDAFYLLAARAQGLGMSENLRIRGQGGSVQSSAFHRLMRTSDALLEAVLENESIPETAQDWKSAVTDCRAELQAIVTHLDTRGVNLDVVYAMDVIEQSLKRMELISGVLVAHSGAPKMVTALRLLRDVIRGRLHDRSLIGLAQNSFRLLAKKIVEWAGKTGEHYVTNNREEYRQMWYAALGGGLLTVGTAAIKMMVTHRGLPPFVEGFLAGLNYAISFVLMHVFHLALATKQPSMTGAALAGILHRCQDAAKSEELVSYVQRIVRSQLAAAFGNILAVGAGAVVFSIIWNRTFGQPFLNVETAEYAVKSMNPARERHHLFCHSYRRDSLALEPGRRLDRELGRLSPAPPRHCRASPRLFLQTRNAAAFFRILCAQHCSLGWLDRAWFHARHDALHRPFLRPAPGRASRDAVYRHSRAGNYFSRAGGARPGRLDLGFSWNCSDVRDESRGQLLSGVAPRASRAGYSAQRKP